MQSSRQVSPFGWNAGGWFGSVLGSTAWMLILGVSVVSEDLAGAVLSIIGFAAANLWGVALWLRRDRLSAYAGLQWMMIGLLVVFAAVVFGTNLLPFWVFAAPLPLMAIFWLRQQASREPNEGAQTDERRGGARG